MMDDPDHDDISDDFIQSCFDWMGNADIVGEPEKAGPELRNFLNRNGKNTAVSMAVDLWNVMTRQDILLRKYRKEIAELNGKLVITQSQVIESQKQVIAAQTTQLHGIQDTVSTSVKNSVKQEIKSYSEAVKSSSDLPEVSRNIIKNVAKIVVREEDRSKNLMLFGLVEETGEDLGKTVSDVLLSIDEKPHLVCCQRVGLKRDGATRPVKVVFSSGSAVNQCIMKSSQMRLSSSFKDVFLGPDRTRDERKERRDLVKEIKRLRVVDSSKKYLIRSGKICVQDSSKNT